MTLVRRLLVVSLLAACHTDSDKAAGNTDTEAPDVVTVTPGTDTDLPVDTDPVVDTDDDDTDPLAPRTGNTACVVSPLPAATPHPTRQVVDAVQLAVRWTHATIPLGSVAVVFTAGGTAAGSWTTDLDGAWTVSIPACTNLDVRTFAGAREPMTTHGVVLGPSDTTVRPWSAEAGSTAALGSALGITVDPTGGVVVLDVLDCEGIGLAGATIEIDGAPDAVPFTGAFDAAVATVPTTDVTGRLGLAQVPAGVHTVSAWGRVSSVRTLLAQGSVTVTEGAFHALTLHAGVSGPAFPADCLTAAR